MVERFDKQNPQPESPEPQEPDEPLTRGQATYLQVANYINRNSAGHSIRERGETDTNALVLSMKFDALPDEEQASAAFFRATVNRDAPAIGERIERVLRKGHLVNVITAARRSERKMKQ